MWLERYTSEEKVTLMAIASLAASLPKGIVEYTDAIIQINRNYFRPVEKVPSRSPAGRSVTQTHTIRAS